MIYAGTEKFYVDKVDRRRIGSAPAPSFAFKLAVDQQPAGNVAMLAESRERARHGAGLVRAAGRDELSRRTQAGNVAAVQVHAAKWSIEMQAPGPVWAPISPALDIAMVSEPTSVDTTSIAAGSAARHDRGELWRGRNIGPRCISPASDAAFDSRRACIPRVIVNRLEPACGNSRQACLPAFNRAAFRNAAGGTDRHEPLTRRGLDEPTAVAPYMSRLVAAPRSRHIRIARSRSVNDPNSTWSLRTPE